MKTIELAVVAVVDSDKATLAELDQDEAAKAAACRDASAVLVAAIAKAGVRVRSATLTIAPPEGAHEQSETVDLTVPPDPVSPPVEVATANA